MVFALGLLIAGLLALGILPAFWRRALRLSTRRLEMQIPLSAREILAERDQLRAEFAVERRRIEQKIEAAVQSRAGNMAELGRRAALLAGLRTDLNALAKLNGEQAHELADAQRALAEAEAETAATRKALYDATGLHERKRQELADLTHAHGTLESLADQQRASLSALTMHASGLQAQLDDSDRAHHNAETKLTDKTYQAALLSEELASARSEIGHLTSNREAAHKKIEAEVARRAALEGELARLRSEREEDAARVRSLKLKLEIGAHELEDLSQRERALQQKQDALLGSVRETERAYNTKLDGFRSESAALRGALEATRRELDRVTAAVRLAPSLSAAPQQEENALLRATISEIGAAVIRLASGTERSVSGVVPIRGLAIDTEPTKKGLRLLRNAQDQVSST